MIAWSSSIDIRRSPDAVFELLANVQNVQQSEGSPVLALDLVTAGPPRLGAKYREVVQMTPLFKGEFLSEITAFDPPRVLEMAWTGPAMTGTDRYEFLPIEDGTRLTHRKWVSGRGVLGVMEPIMRAPLFRRLEQRLVAIKRLLEEGANP